MIAVITGDIIDSARHQPHIWLNVLKTYLAENGREPSDWEVYRGDEFQLKVSPEKALRIALHLKAVVKSIRGLDVRMAIGLGEESFTSSRISECNGTAYQHSGREFERLKKFKNSLQIRSSDKTFDTTMNLMLKLGLDFMDHWSQVSAEMVDKILRNPEASQEELAVQLNIQQSAVSQRLKRARMDLLEEILEFYTIQVKETFGL